MRNPVLPVQSTKSSRRRRRILFVLLSLILLGLVSLGSLRVFQLSGQDEVVVMAPSETTEVDFNDLSSNTDLSSTETASPSLAATENDNSDPATLSVPDEIPPSEYPADEQADLSISGAVLDDAGTLLADISVTARPTPRPGTDQNTTQTSTMQLRQQTDHLGSFIFENLAAGEYELAVAQNEQYHPAKLRVRAGLANAELMLQRIRSVRVFGLITDELGNPLEGVQVRALGSQAQVHSDVSGGYEIQTGPSKAGQVPILDFSLEDYQNSRQRAEGSLDSKNTEVELNVELEWEPNASRVAVSGQITGPTGEPVSAATVWLSSAEFRAYEKTRSDDLGEYHFKSIKTGDAYTLGVDPRDNYTAFRSDRLSIGPGDLEFDVNLEATEFSNLSGTVTDLDGVPLRGFSLWARSMDMGSHPLISVHTDSTGQFRLAQIPSGTIKLESRSQPWLEATGIVLKPGESRQVEVPLDWGQHWLLGQVVDDQGDPVARAKVVLRWTQNFLDVSSASRREVMSDQGGFFALSNLNAQNYILTVQASGYLSSRVQYRRDQSEEEVRVILQRRNSTN